MDNKDNMDELQMITPIPLIFSLDEKVFFITDEETGESKGEPYSYNDWIKKIEDISGVNEDLMERLEIKENGQNDENSL